LERFQRFEVERAQRPGTAKGFVFVSGEDETGTANSIVTPQLFENCRLLISEEPFLSIVESRHPLFAQLREG
jgi:hypothetical protein